MRLVGGLLFMSIGFEIALAAVPNIPGPAQQTSPNQTQQIQQYIQTPGVSCFGTITSEIDGPDSGIPYAYQYKVKWSIKVTQNNSYLQNYSLTYSGDGILSTTKTSQFDNALVNPYTFEANYSFKKTDPDKTVKLNLSMTDYSVSPTKNYSGSCSLSLVNKGAETQVNTTTPGQTSIPQLAFSVTQITPVPTPSTDTTPSYTFRTTRAGSITYGGSCSSPTSNASFGNNTVTFNALSPGTYSDCTIMVTDANQNNSPVLTVNTFTIQAPQSTSTSTSTSTPNTSTDNSTGTGDGDTTGQSSTQTVTLPPSPDILSCKARAQTLYFEFDQPAYDRMGVDCVLLINAMVNVGIYKKEFNPKAADNSANLIKLLKNEEIINKGKFYVDWTGFDDYDQAVALDEYRFVVMAAPDKTYAPDISIQKFTIANAPGAGGEDTSASAENITETDLKGSAPEQKEGVLESVAKAIFGDNSATAEEQAANANREASKCPNIYYPTDIEGSPYKDKIRQAYDECLVRGYEDGTFRPQQSLTRAEATKIIVLATGNLAKQGCYDNDCGSPFVDLDNWQGPWIRAAWDLKMVSGVGPGIFAPNRSITRAEAAALVTKSFRIPPHQGCYDADCGANYQKDIFTDIVLMWEGPYLRALADRGIIDSAAPGKFYPETPISREQFLDMALKARAAK